MVKLFWVTETRQAIHFECISVKLSVDSMAGDHVYWWNWIIFLHSRKSSGFHLQGFGYGALDHGVSHLEGDMSVIYQVFFTF